MPPIRRLLIANRGEIATRIIRTARAMGITTVAVFSDPDEDAPFVALADQAVRLPGSAPERHLSQHRRLILAAAESSRADAVHPGYGFLSENAAFARVCATAGLIFVGPPAEAIEAMGSKPAAKTLMAEAGVPVLPGVTVDQGLDLAAAAEGIGWPGPRQGGVRRRRPGHAGRPFDARAGRGGGIGDAGGGGRVRRWHRVPRAVRRISPPHRGPGVRRQPGQRGPALRTRSAPSSAGTRRSSRSPRRPP